MPLGHVSVNDLPFSTTFNASYLLGGNHICVTATLSFKSIFSVSITPQPYSAPTVRLYAVITLNPAVSYLARNAKFGREMSHLPNIHILHASLLVRVPIEQHSVCTNLSTRLAV